MNDVPSTGDILIVDDEQRNLTELQEILAGGGHNVRPTLSGEAAIEAALVRPPDLVLLDILMPEMDGVQVFRSLRQSEPTKDIPVIFLLAYDDNANRARAFRAGGDDCITRPFEAEEVLARVRTHLNLRRAQKSLQEHNGRLAAEISERRKLEEALVDANDQLARLVGVDGLTGIASRHRFDEYLEHEYRRLAREALPLSLIVMDVDLFKAFNDSRGYIAGDDCLRRVAGCARYVVQRPGDLVARYGSEELAVILPDTGSAGASRLAEDIREAVVGLEIEHPASEVSGVVTISVGVATVLPNPGSGPASLLDTVERALHDAKNGGRNRVVTIA